MGEPNAAAKEEVKTGNASEAEKSVENLSTDLDSILQDKKEDENDEDKDDLDDSKAEEDEHDQEELDEHDKPDKIQQQHISSTSLCLKVTGFKRPPNLEDELKKYYRYFTKAVEVEAPLVEIPGPDEKWIYFEMKSLEDREKCIAFTKKGPWENQRIFFKIVLRPTNEFKEMRKLTIEEGLKLLYPEKDTLYSKQLKIKHQAAKEIIEQIIPKSKVEKIINTKKYLKSALRVREIVPMVPVDGYEYHTTILPERNEETGEFTYGVLVLSPSRDASVIVPLDECISVPREMKLVAKELIAKLPDYGLLPFLPSNKSGDVLALSLRMSAYGSFMLTVFIPKLFACVFRQLTEDGVKLEENEDLFSVQIKKRLDDVKSKIGKFYTEFGKDYSVDSVYMVICFHHMITHSLFSNMDESYPPATHIFGQKLLPDKLNGINLRVSWDRDQHVEVFEPLLSLIEAQGQINSTTRVYLVSPFRLLGLYLAKKCSHVTMFSAWSKEVVFENALWAKQLGVNNIEFFNTRSQMKKMFSNKNAAVIFWQFTKPTLLERFIKSEIYNMTFISYCNKPTTAMYTKTHTKLMEMAYSNLRISYICPFDIAPFKDRFGIAVFFNKNRFNVSEPPQQKRKVSDRGRFYFRRDGNFGNKASRLAESSQVSPFKRLGPAPFPRGRTYETVSNDRSDPWIDQPLPKPPGSALRQLDEVATGVMQNLQAVQQQMQAFIPSLMGNNQQPALPPPTPHENSSGWSSNKRRYNEDFNKDNNQYNRWEDNYSSYDERDFKRRREDYSYNDNYQSADTAGRWNQKETWGGTSSGNLPKTEISTYGDPPPSWGNNSHVQEPPYYEKGRSATTGTWMNSTNRSYY